MTSDQPFAQKVHEVSVGEWISNIALRYGFADWRVVWEDPGNVALRKTRKDPNMLAPGDRVFIPQFTPKFEPVQTGQRVRFQVQRARHLLRIRLMDEEGIPVANARYELLIEPDLCEAIISGERRTDQHGMIVERIPGSATSSQLQLPDLGITIALKIGDLLPIDSSLDPVADKDLSPKGIQQRLANLLFLEHDNQEINDDTLQLAVRAFQMHCQEHAATLGYDAGSVDGRITLQLRRALMRMHEDDNDH